MPITNTSGVSLPLAVWAVHDEYDYINEPNYISATKLMKPVRQTVLGPRIPASQRTEDVADYISRAFGHSLHDSIEKAWAKGYQTNLKKLGYPQDVIDRVRINPTKEELFEGCIAVYIEQREMRNIVVNGITYTIGGKFDMVADGAVNDNKSTTAYTWLYGGKDGDYILQGSIYRWLNPEKITEDYIRINYVFTDWQKMQAKANPKYPQSRVMYKDYPLMSLAETEQWIRNRIALIQKYKDAPESEIIECTDEELWRADPQYKYYADPAKMARSTKNFDNQAEANAFWKVEKGGKGVVVTFPGKVKRCGYCEAFAGCSQKDKYEHD